MWGGGGGGGGGGDGCSIAETDGGSWGESNDRGDVAYWAAMASIIFQYKKASEEKMFAIAKGSNAAGL